MTINRNWKMFALLLIDIQRDFWTRKLASNFPSFPENIKHLLELCRKEGLEVIHLRAKFQPDMSDWMLRYRLSGTIPCVDGTKGIEILPFSKEEPGETVFIKQTFDGFFNPELLPYLQNRRKRFLLVAGLVTSYCVFLTAASAAQLGFLAAIVEDCCADEPVTHKHTLDRYQQSVFDRTSVRSIRKGYPKWLAELEKLEI